MGCRIVPARSRRHTPGPGSGAPVCGDLSLRQEGPRAHAIRVPASTALTAASRLLRTLRRPPQHAGPIPTATGPFPNTQRPATPPRRHSITKPAPAAASAPPIPRSPPPQDRSRLPATNKESPPPRPRLQRPTTIPTRPALPRPSQTPATAATATTAPLNKHPLLPLHRPRGPPLPAQPGPDNPPEHVAPLRAPKIQTPTPQRTRPPTPKPHHTPHEHQHAAHLAPHPLHLRPPLRPLDLPDRPHLPMHTVFQTAIPPLSAHAPLGPNRPPRLQRMQLALHALRGFVSVRRAERAACRDHECPRSPYV